MATIVGAEYIIANVLIALKRLNKKEFITLDELSRAVIYIQKQSLVDNKTNAIFLSSYKQMVTALYDFSDYFEYDPSDDSIYIVNTKNIDDLENRFIGYLPFNILKFLVNKSIEYVLKNFDCSRVEKK